MELELLVSGVENFRVEQQSLVSGVEKFIMEREDSVVTPSSYGLGVDRGTRSLVSGVDCNAPGFILFCFVSFLFASTWHRIASH